MKKILTIVIAALFTTLAFTGCDWGTKSNPGTSVDYSVCVIGDFILNDGSILSKDTELTDTQKANVVAVIVRAADSENSISALGVGLKQSGYLAWCTTSADGYEKIEPLMQSSGYTDGSDSWSILQSVCSDATEENAATLYPAFNYCLTYASTNNLTESMASGWYFLTISELVTIYNNKSTINESLAKVDGDQFDTSNEYWCCSQYDGNKNSAFVQKFSSDASVSGYKYNSSAMRVCCVRAFN